MYAIRSYYGDEVIVFAPYFVDYNYYIDNHGGVTVEVMTNDEFQPDLEAIESAINKRTRAIILKLWKKVRPTASCCAGLTALGSSSGRCRILPS